MTSRVFEILIALVALGFVVFFSVTVIPSLIANFDVIGAFAAGFVNPYSSGYSADVIACWLILFVWVLYEKNSLKIKYGWVCVLLGIVPGVAVGFAIYLILRQRQLEKMKDKFKNSNMHCES